MIMYFTDRAQAGELLASQLINYRYKQTVVLALSVGGVLVGEQIAKRLHCKLALLLIQRIAAQADPSLVLGTLDQEGEFMYNDLITAGEMEEYLQDMRNYLEEKKLQEFYQMTSLLGEGGLVDRDSLVDHNVVIATDGLKTGLSFDAAMHFLKPISTKQIIGAVPVAPAGVIERLNLRLDELHYLYIPDNFFSPKHYYEDNKMPDPNRVISTINQVTSRWE